METKILNYFIDHKESLFPKGNLKFTTQADIIKINNLLQDPAIPGKTSQIIKSTQWILTLDDPRFGTPFGLYKDKNIIIYFDQEILLRFAAKNIQDIPFLIYSFNYGYTLEPFSDEERADALENLTNLNIYSNWCKTNHIEFDPLHLHHDGNGNIISNLSKFYKYEKMHYNSIFPTHEEQELIDE